MKTENKTICFNHSVGYKRTIQAEYIEQRVYEILNDWNTKLPRGDGSEPGVFTREFHRDILEILSLVMEAQSLGFCPMMFDKDERE